VAVVIIPVFDTLRVIILRLRRMQSPFKADRNHLHHQFLNLGFTHAKAVLTLSAINLVFIGIAWALQDYTDHLIMPLILLICLAINYILKRAQAARVH
jgi:UDP-N-acetylmuramyl pentapeptide phosphotransferase/UDP-N-acetylglucosamine-1-phosphate transferase